MKNKKVKKIDSNIAESFVVINDYLPKRYVAKVLEKIPGTPEYIIRQVKSRKTGDLKIIAALRQVAEESKTILK